MEHHKKYALKDNCIGWLNFWGFKEIYLFLNFERGIIEELKTLDGVEIMDFKKYDELYKQRNIKEGNERERTYGKVHESMLKVWTDGTDAKGNHSNDFVRGLSYMAANVVTHKDLVKLKLPIQPDKCSEEQIIKFREIVKKHHLSKDCTYSVMCDKGFDGEISESEINKIIKEYKKLPGFWKKTPFDNDEEMEALLKTI